MLLVMQIKRRYNRLAFYFVNGKFVFKGCTIHPLVLLSPKEEINSDFVRLSQVTSCSAYREIIVRRSLNSLKSFLHLPRCIRCSLVSHRIGTKLKVNRVKGL